MFPQTGIIILNYNNYSDTINCIKSVYEHCSIQNLLLAVVDNGSQNDSVTQISSFLHYQSYTYKILESDQDINIQESNVFIIQTNENLGYARGNNVGIRFFLNQKTENILILNNDILFISDIITPLVHCLDTQPGIGLISPLLMKDKKNIDYNCCRISPTNKNFICESMQFLKLPGIKKVVDQKYLLKTNPDLINQKLVNCDIVSGACILAKASTWEKLNGFDDNTFLYYEENILFKKLKKLGLKSAILPNQKVIHLGGQSTKTMINISLFIAELKSLTYYLRKYQEISSFQIALIRCLRFFHIFILRLNNYRKLITSKS